ncbi:MAG: DEAD/DEAH box helicase [Acholeplasmatales bacterium]|nr:DEAD/DEAH box helicase [Acholeplasmatales bacterium]
MKLHDMLHKYDNNNTLKVFLENAIPNPGLYARVEVVDGVFVVEPTTLFLSAMIATKTEMKLDKNLKIVEESCSCLHFYKNKDCIHTVALYAVALLLINPEKFNKEYDLYVSEKKAQMEAEIIDSLSESLRINNQYFGMIHLLPVIEVINGQYVLSLKIGYDKDYIIKDISEFVDATENNKSISYGQRLEFIHSYECFDDVSKELYTFVANIKSINAQKCIEIRKSQLLKILEIYLENPIYFRAKDELKPQLRYIRVVDEVKIGLNENELYVEGPEGSKVLVSGVNRAYFYKEDEILAYTYKGRLENKVINYLFKVNGDLNIKANSDKFISSLLPLVRNNLEISDEFYAKYPIPNIKINSYLSYDKEVIYLQPKIACPVNDRTSPYIRELLDAYISTIEAFGFTKGPGKLFMITSLEIQYILLTSDLSSFKAFGEVYFDETMKKLTAKKAKRPSVNVSYDVGLLDFTFNSEDLSPEDLKKMLEAYHEKKKFVRLDDDTILEIDDNVAKEMDDFMEDFNISLKDLTKPVTKPLNYLLKLVSGVDTNVSMDNDVIKMIKTIQNYKKSDYLPRKEFAEKLRSYQIEGFKWLKTLSSYSFGGILADDMGLGKTLEVISFIDSDDTKMPSLIVCPMSLVYNWENECEKWGFNAPVKLILGSIEERTQTINDIDASKKCLYITSYDSLRRDVTLYSNKFRFVIADEAQFIKNQFAQKSEAIKSLQSEINFALTGTPIENGLADLWSIFDFLMPGYLSNYSHFKSRYESLIVHDDTDALDNLKKRVSPFILRRTKKDVLDDLPDKIEDYYYYKMEPKQRDIYNGYVDKLRDDIKEGGNNILALLTRLRQICITPELILQEKFENTKINMAADIIKSSIEAGHRILVFSQFSQSFPILSRELDDMGIKNFILDGTTKAKTRMEMVDEFNSNQDIKVFIISLKAGGTGLNLVGADMVIHLDPWWNSSAELQASDRAYRIGQTKNVYVLKLICKDTIEEKVIELQKIKRELAESVVNSTGIVKLSKQDILDLLD